MTRTPIRSVVGLVATLALAAPLVFAGSAAGQDQSADLVYIPIAGGVASVSTSTMAVTAYTDDGQLIVLSAPPRDALGRQGQVVRLSNGARWSYPDRGIQVTATSSAGRLLVDLKSTVDSAVEWPVTGTDPATSSVQIPRGDGLWVPVGDPWWNGPAAGLVGSTADLNADLTMPFWGHTVGRHGTSYLVPEGIGTVLDFGSVGGRLATSGRHTFSGVEGQRDYLVTFAVTPPTPTSAAVDYRSWLAQHGQLGSLKAKIAANPAAGRLLGAFHAYLWGSARSPAGIGQLTALGLSRMWLGYDADGDPMSPAAVAAAQQAGYLVGPYDSWANAQDPATSDASTSSWPAPVYPQACVHNEDGSVKAGFHGRGCYLSSAALAAAESTRHYLADRVDTTTANGANSYFLDVDAFGEFFDDHSPAHPMTMAADERNRIERMRYLSGDRGLVLGSEKAGAWANQVLSFSHGSATPVTDGLWALERDKAFWGGYAPATAPKFFFQPVRLPADVGKAMFDPAYRVPLYETVLHDSVLSLDRWELPTGKLPDLATTRTLLAMVYDTPLNVVLDGPELSAHGSQIAALQRYFAPLHEAAGTEPMTDFRWLTPDHLVQRTTFGAGTLTVTANFGTTAYRSLPAGCVEATLGGDHQPRRLCPEAW